MDEVEPTPINPLEESALETPIEAVEPLPVVLPLNRPRKVYSGMWGTAEIAAVSFGVFAILLTALLYFFYVVPSNRELAKNKADIDRLDAELASAKSKYGDITDSETQVAKLIGSVNDFEGNFLPAVTNGQSALYQRLNALIAAYGLVNTTGPDYTPLEPADVTSNGQQPDEQKGREKFRSLYPGVYVSTTLEGSYQNLRRFLREIENGKEFVVVSTVELAPSDTEKVKDIEPQKAASNLVGNPIYGAPAAKGLPNGAFPVTSQPQAQVPRVRPQGKKHGETVSLHIELAAYFRRPNFAPVSADPVTP